MGQILANFKASYQYASLSCLTEQTPEDALFMWALRFFPLGANEQVMVVILFLVYDALLDCAYDWNIV
jgi:hypothetical protein